MRLNLFHKDWLFLGFLLYLYGIVITGNLSMIWTIPWELVLFPVFLCTMLVTSGIIFIVLDSIIDWIIKKFKSR